MKYLSVIASLFLITSCSSPKKTLMQTWKVTDVAFLDSLNTMPVKQKKIITEALTKDMQFTFLRDSVYQVHSGNDIVNGKWWMSADKKTLFTSTEQGSVSSRIYELKKKSFVFESIGDMNQSFRFTCSPVLTTKK